VSVLAGVVTSPFWSRHFHDLPNLNDSPAALANFTLAGTENGFASFTCAHPKFSAARSSAPMFAMDVGYRALNSTAATTALGRWSPLSTLKRVHSIWTQRSTQP